MPWICHCCGDQHMCPWWVVANSFSSENSCKNSCSVLWRHHFALWRSPQPLLSCWQQCLRTGEESDTHKPHETSPLLTGSLLHPIIFSGTALVGVKLSKLKSHLLPTRCWMQPGANCSMLQMLLLPGSDNEVL